MPATERRAKIVINSSRGPMQLGLGTPTHPEAVPAFRIPHSASRN
jgi:hypothetical protein